MMVCGCCLDLVALWLGSFGLWWVVGCVSCDWRFRLRVFGFALRWWLLFGFVWLRWLRWL